MHGRYRRLALAVLEHAPALETIKGAQAVAWHAVEGQEDFVPRHNVTRVEMTKEDPLADVVRLRELFPRAVLVNEYEGVVRTWRPDAA